MYVMLLCIHSLIYLQLSQELEKGLQDLVQLFRKFKKITIALFKAEIFFK